MGQDHFRHFKWLVITLLIALAISFTPGAATAEEGTAEPQTDDLDDDNSVMIACGSEAFQSADSTAPVFITLGTLNGV